MPGIEKLRIHPDDFADSWRSWRFHAEEDLECSDSLERCKRLEPYIAGRVMARDDYWWPSGVSWDVIEIVKRRLSPAGAA